MSPIPNTKEAPSVIINPKKTLLELFFIFPSPENQINFIIHDQLLNDK